MNLIRLKIFSLIIFLLGCQNYSTIVNAHVQNISFEIEDSFIPSLEHWNNNENTTPNHCRVEYDWNANGSIDFIESFIYDENNKLTQQWRDDNADGIIDYQRDQKIGENYSHAYQINKKDASFIHRISNQCSPQESCVCEDVLAFNRLQDFQLVTFYKSRRTLICDEQNHLKFHQSDNVHWRPDEPPLLLDGIPDHQIRVIEKFNLQNQLIETIVYDKYEPESEEQLSRKVNYQYDNLNRLTERKEYYDEYISVEYHERNNRRVILPRGGFDCHFYNRTIYDDKNRRIISYKRTQKCKNEKSTETLTIKDYNASHSVPLADTPNDHENITKLQILGIKSESSDIWSGDLNDPRWKGGTATIYHHSNHPNALTIETARIEAIDAPYKPHTIEVTTEYAPGSLFTKTYFKKSNAFDDQQLGNILKYEPWRVFNRWVITQADYWFETTKQFPSGSFRVLTHKQIGWHQSLADPHKVECYDCGESYKPTWIDAHKERIKRDEPWRMDGDLILDVFERWYYDDKNQLAAYKLYGDPKTPTFSLDYHVNEDAHNRLITYEYDLLGRLRRRNVDLWHNGVLDKIETYYYEDCVMLPPITPPSEDILNLPPEALPQPPTSTP